MVRPMSPPAISPYPGFSIEQHDTVWSGRFPLEVVKFRHRRFDGATSAVRTWELFRRGRAAALLPYDPWTDQVVLIQQFRLPALAAGVDPVMVELPAGLCDGDEDPETTVRRETMEETGLHPDLLTPVADVVLTPGGSDERCAIFAGRVRAPAGGADGVAGYGGLAAEHEDIRVIAMPAQTAIDQALDGAYANSVTVIALLWLAARRNQLRTEWAI
jgi:ADP-ribose pyrophosphatase